MSWLGIVGGMLTILSNVQGVLDLAKWASWLAERWAYYVVSIARALFGFVGIRIDANASMTICMSVFILLIAIAARIENETRSTEPEAWPISWRRAVNWRIAAAVLIYLTLSSLTYYVYYIAVLGDAYRSNPTLLTIIANLIYVAAVVIGLKDWPLTTAVPVSMLMAALNYISHHSPIRNVPDATISTETSQILAVMVAVFAGITVLIIAPPQAFCRRLIYMFVGVAVLVALSKVSNLILSLSTPAVG